MLMVPLLKACHVSDLSHSQESVGVGNYWQLSGFSVTRPNLVCEEYNRVLMVSYY
jgi:hypothetical protein